MGPMPVNDKRNNLNRFDLKSVRNPRFHFTDIRQSAGKTVVRSYFENVGNEMYRVIRTKVQKNLRLSFSGTDLRILVGRRLFSTNKVLTIIILFKT